MKTRLLKKVRRDYEITYVTKNNNPNHWLYEKKVPYFILKETQEYGFKWVFDTYQEAISFLAEKIRSKYFHLHKKESIKEQKVWHVLKQTK